MNNDYTPTETEMRDLYVWNSSLDMGEVRPSVSNDAISAEFDRFLARVKRDAARAALDGLAEAELARVASLGKHSYPTQIAQGIAQAAWNYKHKNYGGAHPEETP